MSVSCSLMREQRRSSVYFRSIHRPGLFHKKYISASFLHPCSLLLPLDGTTTSIIPAAKRYILRTMFTRLMVNRSRVIVRSSRHLVAWLVSQGRGHTEIVVNCLRHGLHGSLVRRREVWGGGLGWRGSSSQACAVSQPTSLISLPRDPVLPSHQSLCER